MDWYKTNFQRGQKGNMLSFGTPELKIKIEGARWMAGRLSMRKGNGFKVIQIEQSGTKNNPWNDKIVFELVKKNGKSTSPLPSGEYRITVRAGKAGVQGIKDVFYIA